MDGYKDSELKYEEAEDLEEKEEKYQWAIKNYEEKTYVNAIATLKEITPYKDSEELLKQYKYEYGEYLMQVNYDNAIEQFEELDDYKDSKERIQYINELKEKDNKYIEAKKLFKDYYSKERYDRARELFEEIGDYKDSSEYLNKIDSIKIFNVENIAEASIGDYVVFGLYGERITWYVADKVNGKLFLICTTFIGDEEFSYATIAGNSVNESFLDLIKDQCFSDNEKKLIDKVTLISKSEAEKYLVSNKMIILYDKNGVSCSWWLRDNRGVRYFVDITGIISIELSQGYEKHYFRPAMWVKIP